MGGYLLFDLSLPVPPPPNLVRNYTVSLDVVPSRGEAERWARRAGILSPWVGQDMLAGDDAPRYFALSDTGEAVIIAGDGVTYLRVWGAMPPLQGMTEGETVIRTFLRTFAPEYPEVRLRLEADGPLVTWYDVAPILDGIPLVGMPPWARVELRPSAQVARVNLLPLAVSAQTVYPGTSLGELLDALRSPVPPAPLARQVRPLVGPASGHFPIAERTPAFAWEIGTTVRVVGTPWVVQGGESGREVRGWVRSPLGVFEVVPVMEAFLQQARRGEVLVRGTLAAVDPLARWGKLFLTGVEPAPPRATREGTLSVRESGVWLLSEGERLLLVGAPSTLPEGARVLVTGYEMGGDFSWEHVYLSPTDFPTLPPPDTIPRPVVSVEPVYWLAWRAGAPAGFPAEGEIIPAWKVVTTAPGYEEVLLYPMRWRAEQR